MRFYIALLVLILPGCLKDGETTIEKCQTDLATKEVNTTSTPTSFSFSDVIAVRVRLFERLLVKRVMFKGTVPAASAIHVDFYQNAYTDLPDSGVHLGSSGANLTSGYGAAGENWFVLSSPIQLDANSDLMNGLVMVVHFGSGTFSLDVGSSNGALMRYDFRTGASGGSWNSVDSTTMISLGLSGDIDCE